MSVLTSTRLLSLIVHLNTSIAYISARDGESDGKMNTLTSVDEAHHQLTLPALSSFKEKGGQQAASPQTELLHNKRLALETPEKADESR